MQLFHCNFEAEISFENNSIERMLTLCEKAVESVTEDSSARFKLKSVIHELVTNCIEHGYQKKTGKINVTIKRLPDRVYFEIYDEGTGFDLSQVSTDRKLDALEHATSRGWGLSIIRSITKDFKISENSPHGTHISLYVPL